MTNIKKYFICRYRNIDPKSSKDKPTPTEFVQFILDSAEAHGPLDLDSHIKPIWASCPFCAIDFDIIGKLEDYEEDENFVVQKLNLDIRLGLHRNSAGGKSKSEKRIEFFSEIPTELTQKLFKIYELDFDMFGYQKPVL